MRALRECRVSWEGPGSAWERVLGAKGSRKRVCSQVCVGSPVSALMSVMPRGSGWDRAQMHHLRV